MDDMLSKLESNAMIVVMRYLIGILMCLLFIGCVKTSEQATDELWGHWQGIDDLLQQDYPDAPPIILVHGWNGSEFTWSSIDSLRNFEARLHRDVYFFTYRTGVVASRFPPIEVLEEELERYLASFKQVDVIAHSMGGLVVRQYLSHHSEHPIRRLLFLSTPHFGSDVAVFLERAASVSNEGNLQADEMLPGSDFLWQLNQQEGQELQNVEVLNAYIDGDSVLDRDLVVSSHAAWLPWAANVSVSTGNHHSLAAGLMQDDFILNFLALGALPKLAAMPERRDVWIRIRNKNGELVALTSNALRRMNGKLQPDQHHVSVCCVRPSALHETARQSLLVEDIQPDDVLWFTQRNGQKPMVLKDSGHMEQYRMPITLQEVVLTNGEMP